MALRVLITGATGFVGRSVSALAVRRGLEVRCALHRGDSKTVGESVVVGKIDQATDWSRALEDVDVVIHLAARVHVMHDNADDPLGEFRKVNVAGTERLARSAAAAGVKRLVYVSSIKVNGDATHEGHRFTEDDQPNPQDPYGVSKYEAEQVLHRIGTETGMKTVVVRPPLVYGPGVKGNFAQMMNVLARGIPLPLASVHNLRSLIYVENLADALVLCATHPGVAGKTYLVSDGDGISTPDLLRQLGAAVGKPARLFGFPLALLKVAGRLAGRSEAIERLLGSLQVDGSRMRRELGWMPPYSMQQGLQETAEWYRKNYP
jgi:nucleoside-diphosphate-sugar epimerase